MKLSELSASDNCGLWNYSLGMRLACLSDLGPLAERSRPETQNQGQRGAGCSAGSAGSRPRGPRRPRRRPDLPLADRVPRLLERGEGSIRGSGVGVIAVCSHGEGFRRGGVARQRHRALSADSSSSG